jgi:hypothetical protein
VIISEGGIDPMVDCSLDEVSAVVPAIGVEVRTMACDAPEWLWLPGDVWSDDTVTVVGCGIASGIPPGENSSTGSTVI